jgi:hypothetical protein
MACAGLVPRRLFSFPGGVLGCSLVGDSIQGRNERGYAVVSKKKKGNRLDRLTAFYEVLSMCGDPEKSAQLVNMGLDQAYRALRGPDGFDRLDELQSEERGTYYAMSPAQLKAFLTQGVACGVLPRVLLDMKTGLPLVDGNGQAVVVFEYVSDNVRMKCTEMLGKTLGAFIDRKAITVDAQDPNEITPEIREALDDLYTKDKPAQKGQVDFDPLAV